MPDEKSKVHKSHCKEKLIVIRSPIKNPKGYITYLSIANQMDTVMALKHKNEAA